jgi:hypothetical protein
MSTVVVEFRATQVAAGIFQQTFPSRQTPLRFSDEPPFKGNNAMREPDILRQFQFPRAVNSLDGHHHGRFTDFDAVNHDLLVTDFHGGLVALCKGLVVDQRESSVGRAADRTGANPET